MDSRTEPRLPITCAAAFSGYKLEREGRVRNMSLNGWALESDEPIPPGTPLFLTISLPDCEDPLEIELATVRWWREGSCGLRTIIVGTESRERLEDFLSQHLGAAETSVSTSTEDAS